ncbi:hypothetical protein EDC04DRAFT_1107352 [Pisolithus marmoratus]|nr:hypothetical protein EDC04DRAFT_1107352 [Pisolithus marmoratus]
MYSPTPIGDTPKQFHGLYNERNLLQFPSDSDCPAYIEDDISSLLMDLLNVEDFNINEPFSHLPTAPSLPLTDGSVSPDTQRLYDSGESAALSSVVLMPGPESTMDDLLLATHVHTSVPTDISIKQLSPEGSALQSTPSLLVVQCKDYATNKVIPQRCYWFPCVYGVVQGNCCGAPVVWCLRRVTHLRTHHSSRHVQEPGKLCREVHFLMAYRRHADHWWRVQNISNWKA